MYTINIHPKMENHISKQSPRVLSLCGKVILLNTPILPKATFLGNIFPLDGVTTPKVYKNIVQYFKNNQKSEPIAIETILFKKKLGGLYLIEPEAHNYDMRLKYLLTLKQNLYPSPWKNLATW